MWEKWQILYLQTRYRSKLGWFFWFGPIYVTIRRNLGSDEGTLILLSTLSLTRILLDHVDKVDIPDSRGYTPLHIASKASLADNVLLLLKHGANPNAQGNDGATPLHKSREAIQ